MDVTASAGMDYGAQKKLLAASDLAARLGLAAAADTRPEILYYWASDESTEVRQDAIGDSDQGFVIQGIALKSGLPSDVVAKVLASTDARAVTAVAGNADLSMRKAMQLHLRIARVYAQSILNAHNSVDYPLSEAELEKQLKRLV
jgi:hypothetical protein